MSVLEQIPNIALYGTIGAVVLIVIFNLVRKYAPAADGITLGYLEVEGRYAGGKLLKRIKGTLVDATSGFVNAGLAPKIKQMIFDEMARRNEKLSDEEKKLMDEVPLDRLCRIIVTRASEHGVYKKHLFVQWKYVDKPLNEYAKHEPESKFSLGFGFMSKGVISGVLDTCLQPWNVPKLSKCTVHFFIPDVSKDEKEIEFDWKPLAKMVLFAPASIEMNELLKSMADRVKQKDHEVAAMARDMSGMATELGFYKRLVKQFQEKGKLPKNLFSKFDVVDLVIMVLSGLAGVVAAGQLQSQPVLGVVVGLLLGALVVFKRR